MKLRSYQSAASDAIFKEWQENDSTLVVMPTGGGKTVLFADVIRRVFPRRALVIAHREELIFQARDKIQRVTGLSADVEMGEYRADGGLFEQARVVVSTIQTQCSGGDGGGRMSKFDPQRFGVLIIDEAHHATSPSYRRVIDYYRTNPALKVLGVTATPDRADEEALGQVFQSVAFDYEVLDAIHDGWLVPIEQQMVHVEGLDYSSIRTTAGDLNGGDLAAVLEAEKNLQQMASASLAIIGARRALVFTASVKAAELTAEIFNRHRPNMAAWVCGKTEREERRRVLADFASGKVQVVCNCGVLTEGFDDPGVEVVIMGRPDEEPVAVFADGGPVHPAVAGGGGRAGDSGGAQGGDRREHEALVPGGGFRRQRREAQARHQRGHPGREGERGSAGAGGKARPHGGRTGEHDRSAGRGRSRAARAEAAGRGRAARRAGGEGAVHDAVGGPVRRAVARTGASAGLGPGPAAHGKAAVAAGAAGDQPGEGFVRGGPAIDRGDLPALGREAVFVQAGEGAPEIRLRHPGELRGSVGDD